MGELIFAMVICHFDIGYVLSFLSHGTNAPTEGHYTALKHVCCYFHPCADYGIIYWQKKPYTNLPVGDFKPLSINPELLEIPAQDPF